MRIPVTVEVEVNAHDVIAEMIATPDTLLKISTIHQLMDSISTEDLNILANDATLKELLPVDHPMFGVIARVRAFKSPV